MSSLTDYLVIKFGGDSIKSKLGKNEGKEKAIIKRFTLVSMKLPCIEKEAYSTVNAKIESRVKKSRIPKKLLSIK